MRRSLVAVALSAVVLAACGSVTDSVSFHAPPGYKSSTSLGPFMQIWQSGDGKSAMMLMAFPGQIDINKALDDAQIKEAKIKKKERLTICGNQPAIYAQAEGTTNTDIKVGVNAGKSSAHESNVDFLATNANGKTYFAMYFRPLHAAPDAQAEAALRGLCAK